MNLYLAHVGYYDKENGIYEIHTNIFVAAEDISHAKEKIKQKDIYINKNMHIDGVIEILNVDGYNIKLESQMSKIYNKEFSHDEVKRVQ